MNKNRQKILMYAEVSRKLSEVQDTYVSNIVDELLKIHPDINEINPEDSAENWACDIINASDNHEVVETLNRLNDILKEKRSTNREFSIEERLNIKNKELMEYIDKLERELLIIKSVHQSNY